MTAPKGTTQLPPQLSTIAPEVDDMYMFIYWVAVVSFLLITGFMVYYVVKYRRREGMKAEPTGHSTLIELVWTLSPLILLAYLILSEHVPRFQRWHSYKAHAIIACLEVVFWSGVAGLTFQANTKSCVGVTCGLSWVVMVLAVIIM